MCQTLSIACILSIHKGTQLQIAASPQNRYFSIEQHIFGHNKIIKFVTIKIVTSRVDEPLRLSIQLNNSDNWIISLMDWVYWMSCNIKLLYHVALSNKRNIYT